MANSWRYAKSKQCVGISARATPYVAIPACKHPFSVISENPEIQEITNKLQQIDHHFRRHLNVEVVDDTALIDTSFISKKKIPAKINPPQEIRRNNGADKIKKKTTVKSKPKRKCRKDWKIKKTTSAAENKKEKEKKKMMKKKAYSRAEMVALSLQNVDDQRKKWSEVYGALAASVAAEYDGLVVAAAVRGPTFGVYRRPFMENKPHFIDGAAMGKRSPLKISVH